MTDEELAAIRQALDKPEVMLDEAIWTLNQLVPPLIDENAAMREIVQAVAKYDATYCGLELGHECAFNAQQRARSGGQYFGCHWNKGEADRTRHMFIHGPACPVTKARALLGMEG